MTDPHTLAETERAMRDHVAPLGLDFEAAHAVSSIYRAANAVRWHVTNEVLRPYDLSWTGFVVLWVVWIWESLESTQAADAAAVSKATLTGVVRTLTGRGLIRKDSPADDRRKAILTLTPAGVALMKDLYPKFNAVESQVVAGLSSRRRKEMTASLRAIVSAIETVGQSGE